MRLERPIIFFDIESTGVETETARIVELACIKYNPDGTKEEKTIKVNPTIPIPLEASEVHGITDEEVKDLPTFKQYAQAIRNWFEGSDLAGFNSNNYDVPLLSAEFERAGLEGINWNPTLFDVLTLYRDLFPNTLSAVYERLTGEELEGAHGAVADILATKQIADIIFPLLVEKSETPIETPKDVDEYLQGDKKRFDLSGKMYIDVEGIVKWNFSKNKDKAVLADAGFVNWFMQQGFPQESKNKIKELQNNNKKES
ncbi:MAG TPA: 3'-5' exonuclease [Nitrososphaeraceae archaeon]|nr:3'-5' exonuclease [Nitrososphaeraceae archaeon]